MLLMSVNLWAALGAAVAAMVAGFLWSSPFLFAKPWMIAKGYDPTTKPGSRRCKREPGSSTGLHFWPAC